MDLHDPRFWIPVSIALAASIALTPIVRTMARRYGVVARPKSDRWHKKPTAMLGGVAIFLAVAAGILFGIGPSKFNWIILASSAVLAVFGLLDDFFEFKPYQKLIVQIMCAAGVVHGGLMLHWTGFVPFNQALTIVWIVGITNAVNLLDNMDGLAAGIGAIASFFLALNFFSLGQSVEGTAIMVLAAALVGFLVYNSNPASIFMGDCGSMFIGFFLAATALLTTTAGRARSFIPVIAVPVLTFLIPIFDTTLVALMRKLAGRSVSKGGRDHTSHRLVALGLSERRAVWLLYGLGAISGFLALQVRHWQAHESIAAVVGVIVILTMAGTYLGGVKVYGPDETREQPLVEFLVDISYKRRMFEVLLDVTLIGLAHYLAYTLRFGRLSEDSVNLNYFGLSVPVIVFVKIGVFLAMGVYRGLWRYTSLHDVWTLVKACFVASVCSVLLIVYLFGWYGFSRSVFILDGLLLVMMVVVSRNAFRLVRRVIPALNVSQGRRVLIYGAGDAGELLYRELFNNQDLQYAPVGFIDDDLKKAGKVMYGLKVFSGAELAKVCESERVEEVVLSTSRVGHARLTDIARICDRIGVPLRQMRIELALVNSWDADPLVQVKDHPMPVGPRLTIRAHGSTHVVDTPIALPPHAEARCRVAEIQSCRVSEGLTLQLCNSVTLQL
ncbi:MAG TPA: hypothetical protein VMU84_13095 [Thermoanaerobaculia bacterium]|nr:hypothetical protein [Thermoanaerobaculia bacterium]